MTFKEKLIQEHPEKAELAEFSITIGCPYFYGYESVESSACNCRLGGGNGCVYCWNRKIPEPELKVGDVVRIKDGLVENRKYGGIALLPDMNFLGTGTIKSIRGSRNQFYDIGAFTYTKEMLEKVEERRDDMEKEFTKADLKDGMVVEYRDGKRRIVAGEVLYGLDGFTSLKTHCNDLTYSDSDLDIVKVYAQKAASLNSLFKYPGKIIWERQEEPTTRDVSLEELNAILKEKYPDIDKFNLPIKE